MAGTVDFVHRCYTGLAVHDGVLRLAPQLPDEVQRLEFSIRFRHVWG